MHTLDHTINIIEVDNVSFAFDGEKVLENVSINLHLGEFLGVIGPNGSGKTTLFKIMLGILKPTSGTVRIFGKRLEDFREWKRLGYVAQRAAGFDPGFPATVREVVAMGRYAQVGLFHMMGKSDWGVVDKALGAVEMEKYRERVVGELSGGQQQRVFIARALASEPEVILLDEPTVGVDQKTQEEFYLLLKKLNDKLKLTLALISHDIAVVAKEATAIALINKRLIYFGDPKGLTHEEIVSQLYGKRVKEIGRHA